jgi:hypothetical protein
VLDPQHKTFHLTTNRQQILRFCQRNEDGDGRRTHHAITLYSIYMGSFILLNGCDARMSAVQYFATAIRTRRTCTYLFYSVQPSDYLLPTSPIAYCLAGHGFILVRFSDEASKPAENFKPIPFLAVMKANFISEITFKLPNEPKDFNG